MLGQGRGLGCHRAAGAGTRGVEEGTPGKTRALQLVARLSWRERSGGPGSLLTRLNDTSSALDSALGRQAVHELALGPGRRHESLVHLE